MSQKSIALLLLILLISTLIYLTVSPSGFIYNYLHQEKEKPSKHKHPYTAPLWFAGNFYHASFITADPDNPLQSRLWTRNNVNLKDKGNIQTPTLKWKTDLGSEYNYGRCQPIIADIDKDGDVEIVTPVNPCVAGKGYVFCFNGKDGTIEWQTQNIPGLLWDRLTGFDIDQDGYVEIFATVSDTAYSSSYGLYCINYDGSIRWRFHQAGIVSVACFDIDNDQNIELIASGADGKLYCLDYDGNIEWAVQLSTTYTLVDIAIGDINNDGNYEILTNAMGNWDENGTIYCTQQNGDLLWSKFFSAAPPQLLCLYDIDGDDELETVYDLFYGSPYATGNIGCLDSNGNIIWNYTTGSYVDNHQASVYDINHDGYAEICLGASGSDQFICLNHQGKLLWNYTTGLRAEASVCMADINGDGEIEILFGSRDGYLYCLNRYGTLLWKYLSPGVIFYNVAVDDVDGDGLAEIIYTSGDGGNHYRLLCLE